MPLSKFFSPLDLVANLEAANGPVVVWKHVSASRERIVGGKSALQVPPFVCARSQCHLCVVMDSDFTGEFDKGVALPLLCFGP